MSTSKFSDPFMMKDPLSPLRGNAFIKAKMDAEAAGKSSFSVDGKNYPLKMEEESPLNHVQKTEHMHVGERTGEIEKDEKSEYVVDMYNSDTLRPANGKRFNPNKVAQGYVMGGDYPTIKISDKNFKLK